MPGSFDNGVVGCRRAVSSLGPTDVDSDGDEDFRFEAKVKPTVMMNQCGAFQCMQADLLRWQVMRAFLRRKRSSLVSQVAENAPIVRVSEMRSAL